MSFHIVADSCCELTADMKKRGNIEIAPLTLEVGGESILDDETFDQKYFLKRVAECPECPKSACPSPDYFRKSFLNGAERCYAVTLSAQLSGSYNSANLAKKLYAETNPFTKVEVIDSKSASAGETLIGIKIAECEAKDMEFEDIVSEANKYRDSLSTMFVLEDLSFLERNGRLTGMKKLAANLLHIVPIMGATDQGTIYQMDQARGIKKAMSKLVDKIIEDCKKCNPEKLIIAHCNCPERAEDLKARILEKVSGLTIFINDTRGVASLYAGNKGIIVAF